MTREGNEMSGKIARKLRQRRQLNELNRVISAASPAMRQELIAAAAHRDFIR
jgi:hypothetical protein